MAEAKKQLGPKDCLTPTFRASYLTVFEPRAADAAKPDDKSWGVEMWFRVKHTPESQAAHEEIVDIKDLTAAAEAACNEAWGLDKSKWPAGYKHPFKNGDEKTGKNGAIPGCIVVRAGRKTKTKDGNPIAAPIAVDQNVKDIIDKNQVYSGCYCRAKIHAYVWKHKTGGNGVSFNLDMIQLVRDGEPLGNRMDAEDAFGAIPMPAGTPAGAVAAAGSAAAAPAAGAVFGNLG